MKLFNKKYSAPGTSPGAEKKHANTNFSVNLIDYNENIIEEHNDIDVSTCRKFIDNPNVTWIHVQGDPSAVAMKTLTQGLNIHELYLEDIMNTGQRPKVEVSESQAFVILSLPHRIKDQTHLEQVSLFITQNTLISFCSGVVMPFDVVISRLRNNIGKLRKLPADYLMYSLIDTTIDYGFPLLEEYAERIQNLEDELFEKKDERILSEIHELRREVLLVRRRIWPHREVINNLLRVTDDIVVISPNTTLHMRDCYDHVVSIMDMFETYHEMTSGLMELYLTSVSLRLNDIIKFLTIFTTVFIPPTFLVGLYGMNFDPEVGSMNMPELGWEYGYIGVWLVIATSILGMILFLRRRKWI